MLKNLILSLGVALLTYLVCETAFFAYSYRQELSYLNEQNHYNERVVVAPLLGYHFKPNLRDYAYSESPRNLWGKISTDALGFRNLGRSYEEAEIAVVGDSFMDPVWIEEADSSHRIMEKLSGMKTVSYAVFGWSFHQYNAIIEHWVSKLPRLQLVIVGVYANDFYNYIPYDKCEGKCEDLSPKLWEDHFRKRPAPKIFENFSDRLITGRVLRPFTSKTDICKKNPLKTRNHFILTDLRDYTGAMKQTLEEMKISRNLVKNISPTVKLAIVLLPSQGRIHHDEIEEVCAGKGKQLLETEEAGYREIKKLASLEGISLFDFSDEVKQHAAKGESLYLEQDGHFNKEGNILLGNFLATQVIPQVLKKQLAHQ